MSSKTDAAHHPQGVVAEGHLWLQGCGDDTILEVGESVEGVYEFTKPALIQTDSHRIDSEVAPVLVILQRTVFDDGFARVVTIALLTGSHELHLYLLLMRSSHLHLSRTEVAEHGEMGFPAQQLLQFLSHLDTTAHHYDIDIVRGALKEDITDIAAHHIAFHAHAVSNVSDLVKNLLIQQLR